MNTQREFVEWQFNLFAVARFRVPKSICRRTRWRPDVDGEYRGGLLKNTTWNMEEGKRQEMAGNNYPVNAIIFRTTGTELRFVIIGIFALFYRLIVRFSSLPFWFVPSLLLFTRDKAVAAVGFWYSATLNWVIPPESLLAETHVFPIERRATNFQFSFHQCRETPNDEKLAQIYLMIAHASCYRMRFDLGLIFTSRRGIMIERHGYLLGAYTLCATFCTCSVLLDILVES